ncbi:MAG: fused MFS/spermidine synthase [Gemmatimonadota bacterium]|nr:fused MFS/spermidine synthase [Gemmatimonadota bacterium]
MKYSLFRDKVKLLILFLFFASGACGLVYEVVWMRMLTLVFGATAFATSTILATFFAGLALGSFYFGRVVDKGKNPLAVYALLEVGVGVCAFVMPAIFEVLSFVYVGSARIFDAGFYELSVLRFVMSFMVLLVPTTLMGGTLPVMVKLFAKDRERLAFNVGTLYSVNTFGAVVGAVSAGFLLILILGTREAAYLAGVVNLLIAAAAWAVLKWAPVGELRPRDETVEQKINNQGPAVVATARVRNVALIAGGVSGFCALGLEVFWTRSLVFFLDNSTHAFTTILTACLLGIAVGSVVVSRFVDSRTNLLMWLGWMQVSIGVFAVLAIPLLNHLAPVMQNMAGTEINSALHWKWVGMRFVNAMAVMLVPCALMGMMFPLIAKIYAVNLKTVGAALGNVYAVNTVGGVLGSLTAGFVLIPLVGVQTGIAILGAASVIVGGAVMWFEPSATIIVKRRALLGAGGVLVAGALFYGVNGVLVLSSFQERIESARVLSYDEGIGATVKVYRDNRGDKSISVNGFPVAGTSLAAQDVQIPLAHYPMLLTRNTNPKVNIVGFGAGGTSWGFTRYETTRIDLVELVPAVIRAAPWFQEVNHGVLDDPRFNVIMGDGRNHALVTDQIYDVISIDATTPKMAGNGSLYTLEFYELLRARLNRGGLVVQWLPYHLVSNDEMKMIARTFLTVFPHTSLWFTPSRHHVLLLGSLDNVEIDAVELERKFADPQVRDELAVIGIESPMDFLATFVMGAESLARLVEGARLNTDGHPYLEFTPAMAYFASDIFMTQNMYALREFRHSPARYLVNPEPSTEGGVGLTQLIERRFEANQHSLTGDIYLMLGMRERAAAEYDQALRVDPKEKNQLSGSW